MTTLIFCGFGFLLGVPWRISPNPYYNYLADAFLHGQLSLRLVPPSTLDLSFYRGNYYLYWGALPAVLAMPLVAAFGVQVSDALQTLVVGAINVSLFALLLRRLVEAQFVALSLQRRAVLVMFFALGTAQTPLLMIGTVYFLSHLYNITCVLLAYLAACSWRGRPAFWWTGCAVAGILLTRPSAIVAVIFLVWYLIRFHSALGWHRLIRLCALGIAPGMVALVLIGLYNFLRFGNPFEMGYAYHLMGDQFRNMARQHGIFSPHYIPVNIYLNYIYYPFWDLLSTGHISYPLGGSLLILSPLFLAAPYALWSERNDAGIWILTVTFLVGNIPNLMIMAPGSANFGPRYLLDAIVPLLLLTARGIRRWPTALTATLVGLSAFQYLLGAIILLFGYYKG